MTTESNTTVESASLSDDGRELLRRMRLLFPGVAGDADWLGPTIRHVEAEMAQDGGHDHGHLWRVLANGAQIVRGEQQAARLPAAFSWPAVIAAALLHDLVNLPKDHPERHLASSHSADAAVRFLSGCPGFPNDALDRVAEAIRCHSFSANLTARSLEAQVVADADRLESIGAFAVARTFYVQGRMRGALCHFGDPFAESDRALDDLSYAVDHFFAKLLRLKDRLYTPTALEMAEERHDFMRAFLEQLRAENAAAGGL